VSYSKHPKISYASPRCVSMQTDTPFSSFFKIQMSKTKSYRDINQDIVSVLVRCIECSLQKHQLWLGKAALQVPLKCGSFRSGPHCMKTWRKSTNSDVLIVTYHHHSPLQFKDYFQKLDTAITQGTYKSFYSRITMNNKDDDVQIILSHQPII
jgi:hypothetical protein